jgi:predicted RNA-binding protein associated with RNAse of E/G family
LRWLTGVEATAADADELERALRLHAIHAAQGGLLADMDDVAGALFPRSL